MGQWIIEKQPSTWFAFDFSLHIFGEAFLLFSVIVIALMDLTQATGILRVIPTTHWHENGRAHDLWNEHLGHEMEHAIC